MNGIQEALVQAGGWYQIDRSSKSILQIEEKSCKLKAFDTALVNTQVIVAGIRHITASE